MIPKVTAIPELKMVRIDDGFGLTQIPVEFIRNRLHVNWIESDDDKYEEDVDCDIDEKQWMVDVGNEMSFGPMPSRSEADAFLQEVSNAMIHATSGKVSYNA